MKKSKKISTHLDPEEQKLLSSFEKNEWKTVKNVKKEKSQSRKVATQIKILQEAAESLYTNGLIDETTKQEFDVLFSASEPLPYKKLRNREHLS